MTFGPVAFVEYKNESRPSRSTRPIYKYAEIFITEERTRTTVTVIFLLQLFVLILRAAQIVRNHVTHTL